MSVDRFHSVGIKRSVKDRLGPVDSSPDSSFHQQEVHKRQRQDAAKKNHIVSEKSQENILVRKVIPATLKSASVLPRIVSNASLSGAREIPEITRNISKTRTSDAGSVEVSAIKATPKNRANDAGFAGVSIVKTISKSQPEAGCSPSVSGIKVRSGEGLVSSKKPKMQSGSASNAMEHNKLPLAEDLDVPSFLQSLGLSKYVITFKAEEIDMFALRHMNDGDLKEIGLPMGPRKKILLGLASAITNK